ncbi:MAG TPA: hypothetical protein VEW28_03975 [Candidatus Kapabacteria bacterium]|nr:hypothetical protein [Candidatus Kapabacteria bacterium]
MKKTFNLTASRLVLIILLYPWVVGFTAGEKTPQTIIDFLFGEGAYEKTFTEELRHFVEAQTVSGCGRSSSCNIPAHYEDIGTHIHREQRNNTDVGILVRHEFASGAVLIVKAGYVHSKASISDSYSYGDGSSMKTQDNTSPIDTWWYGLGYGISGTQAGLEGGIVYFDNSRGMEEQLLPLKISPFGRLRIGREDSWYYTMSYLYEPTYLSSGSVFEAGFSFPLSSSSLWVGYGEGPYESSSVIARLNVLLPSSPVSLLISGSYNINRDVSASTFTLGMRYAFK